MPRSKQRPAPSPTEAATEKPRAAPAPIEHLAESMRAINEAIAEMRAEFTDLLADLSKQFEILRVAIDDSRAEFEWATRQATRIYAPLPQAISMPQKPLPADVREQVNRSIDKHFPQGLQPSSASPTASVHQRGLFE